LFECQVIKQLRIFANLINAKIYYYRDTNGIEVDCVIEYKNKYAICEIKLGSLSGINEGCSSLKKFRNILNETQLSNIMS
jgi:predicted AAA+ superfamily ATPase